MPLRRRILYLLCWCWVPSSPLQGPSGERKVPLAEFFTGPGKRWQRRMRFSTQITVFPGTGHA